MKWYILHLEGEWKGEREREMGSRAGRRRGGRVRDMIICSPATPQRPRGETSGTAAGDCDGDPRKMDRPNVGQITFFSGRTKTAEIGREKGRERSRAKMGIGKPVVCWCKNGFIS